MYLAVSFNSYATSTALIEQLCMPMSSSTALADFGLEVVQNLAECSQSYRRVGIVIRQESIAPNDESVADEKEHVMLGGISFAAETQKLLECVKCLESVAL